MEEKNYLKWYNKVGYGSGDIAGNVVFAFLSSFIMIYLTNTVGLNAGVIGSLIAVSKILDGVSDVFFGSMIDKTHSKMGKARPWMLWAYIGCAITLVAAFAVPTDMGKTSQYIWFFITYTLLNAGFYTANNISYSTLTALVTKNAKERVQMGSIRFMFAFGTSFLIQTITIGAVAKLGGSPWQGNLNALVAECSEHTFLKYGKRIDGTMYSCTSMGLKLGGGLGAAIVGWLLDLGGFDGQLAVQSQSCIDMLHFMYLWLPMIINIIIVVLLTQLNVEKANEKLRAEKGIIKK